MSKKTSKNTDICCLSVNHAALRSKNNRDKIMCQGGAICRVERHVYLVIVVSVMHYNGYNKGNATRGVSPRLKFWPGDLDLWPMTLKIIKVPDSLKD